MEEEILLGWLCYRDDKDHRQEYLVHKRRLGCLLWYGLGKMAYVYGSKAYRQLTEC